jgi:hypothetical protein
MRGENITQNNWIKPIKSLASYPEDSKDRVNVFEDSIASLINN